MRFHEQREGQFILALVMTVEGALRHTGFLGNLARGGGVYAFMDEQLQRSTFDLGAGVAGARLGFGLICA